MRRTVVASPDALRKLRYTGVRVALFADLHTEIVKASVFVKKSNPRTSARNPTITTGGLAGIGIP